MQGQDQIYRQPQAYAVDFMFDARVAAVFPDMIRRSVPGYEAMLPMLGTLAARYARSGGRVYDLGCSLGAVSLAVRRQLPGTEGQIIGLDNSPEMIAQAKTLLAQLGDEGWPVRLAVADVRDHAFAEADVVILNFLLQFIAPGERTALLARLYAALRPGGALILSEKTMLAEAETHALVTELHHDFKRANGYSELEISGKRTALERVLIPETEAEHVERLQALGFGPVVRWFQAYQFTSWLALKPEEAHHDG